jgi:hypothetical protein
MKEKEKDYSIDLQNFGGILANEVLIMSKGIREMAEALEVAGTEQTNQIALRIMYDLREEIRSGTITRDFICDCLDPKYKFKMKQHKARKAKEDLLSR